MVFCREERDTLYWQFFDVIKGYLTTGWDQVVSNRDLYSERCLDIQRPAMLSKVSRDFSQSIQALYRVVRQIRS